LSKYKFVDKGNEYLIGLSIDFVKYTKVVPVRPKIPVEKACIMLTPSEVISILTGDFRYNKTRALIFFILQVNEAKRLPKRDN